MIKVSAIRSALRRQALVKVADEYNDMLQSLATRYRADSLVGLGPRVAVRDVRRKEGIKPPVPPARPPVRTAPQARPPVRTVPPARPPVRPSTRPITR